MVVRVNRRHIVGKLPHEQDTPDAVKISLLINSDVLIWTLVGGCIHATQSLLGGQHR